ncbi:MAG: UDP-N-acetylmuramoyl-L-alanyl-D-glutamate--2,6-diaminopimelate ligase [Planctomycetota bacterium]
MTELAFPSGLTASQGLLGLRAIRQSLRTLQVQRYQELIVDGLATHSAEVRPGNLFFAVPGTRNDGSAFAAHAVARGAVAVVAAQPLDVPVPVFVVPDVRAAVSEVSALYYRRPSRALPVIGVTGTNGKTSTTHLIRSCMEGARWKVGLLGTIAYEFDGRRLPASNTTPDAARLQGYLREMVDRSLDACVLEVSSHALEQQRVRDVQFRAGVFLNLSQDHLDYHGDMRSYCRAKAKLFEMLPRGASACINMDDRAGRTMREALAPGVELITFGHDRDAMIRAERVRPTLQGTSFEITLPHGRVELHLPLPGLHNVQNALAAAASSVALGLSDLTVAQALEDATPVRGRLQRVGGRNHAVRVFVDYAHTPDALEKVCATLSGLGQGRLLVVFGCGGDRDPSKRPLMARAVSRYADVAYMTSDNPRSEDPEKILDEVERGVGDVACAYYRIADRARAIQQAVRDARPGDTVLVAGKGHETYQLMRDSVVPFDDAQVAAEALCLRGDTR